MQDVTSFVKASSPLSLTPSGGDSKKIESEKGTSKSFISIMLAQLADSKTEPKTTIKIGKETTIVEAKEESKNPKETKQEAKSIDEHLLGDLLKVLNALKNGTQATVFPTLKSTSRLDKVLNNETALQELKEIKSISDLMNLSKKYDLGLEKLSFSKESVEKIQKEFPMLTKSNFFEKIQEEKNPTPSINPLENQVKKSETTPSSALKDLMSKEVQNESKNAVSSHKVETKVEVASSSEKGSIKEVKTTETIVTQPQKATPTQVETVVQKVVTQTIDETKIDKKIKAEAPKMLSSSDDDAIEVSKPVITRVVEPKMEAQPSQKGLTETLLQNIKTEKPVQEKPLAEVPVISQTTNISNEEMIQEETSELKVNTTEIKTVQKQDIVIKQPTPTRESLNQFASDLREKIENYKPPVMKVELSLNPKNLGEVDITLLTRGNNLHVNISSNPTTMTLFTQNQAEFKNALVNMGFTNLEMNFSDQQKNEQQQKHKNKTKHDEQEQTPIENVTTVEVVIPQYV